MPQRWMYHFTDASETVLYIYRKHDANRPHFETKITTLLRMDLEAIEAMSGND